MLPVVSGFYGQYISVLLLADKCCQCSGTQVDPEIGMSR